MDTVLIIGLAIACLLTGLEGLWRPLGRLRGVLAIVVATIGCIVVTGLNKATVFTVLASTFVGLTASMFVDQSFTGTSVRQRSGLPDRVKPR